MNSNRGDANAMVVGVSYANKIQQRSLPSVSQSQNSSAINNSNNAGFAQKGTELLRTPRSNMIESKGKAVGRDKRLANAKKEAVTAN